MVSMTTDAIECTFFKLTTIKKPTTPDVGNTQTKSFATKDLKEV